MTVAVGSTRSGSDATGVPGAAEAREWLDEHGFPTGREEAWRATPVGEIRRLLDELLAATPDTVEPSRADLDALAPIHGPIRLVFVDGRLVPALSDLSHPQGLGIGAVGSLPPAARGQFAPLGTPTDGFEALNRAATPDVTYLLVDDRCAVPEPVHVVYLTSGAHVAHPRLVVEVGAGASVHLVESFVGVGGGLTNASTSVRLREGSSLRSARVQDEPGDAVHLGRLHVVHGRRADSEITVLSRGASTSRLATALDLLEESASCRLTGLVTPAVGARHDEHVTIDHAASRGTSDLSVRAVVPARSTVTSSGHVVVRRHTAGNDSRQRADSLLLDPTAEADSRPWLEIFADDVRATHGSATGRLDDDALFYLRSRGIPHQRARRILVGAFARAVAEHVRPASLRAQVESWFELDDPR